MRDIPGKHPQNKTSMSSDVIKLTVSHTSEEVRQAVCLSVTEIRPGKHRMECSPGIDSDTNWKY